MRSAPVLTKGGMNRSGGVHKGKEMQERRGSPGGQPGQARPNFKMLGRALSYIPRYRNIAFLAYGSLFVATAAQLMVPQLIQSIIDTLVAAFTGQSPGGLAQTIL